MEIFFYCALWQEGRVRYGRAQVLEVSHCHPRSASTCPQGHPVMSSLIGSAAATACGRPLPGDIPYLLWRYDGPAAAQAYISHMLQLH